MTPGRMTKKKPAYLKPLEKSVLEKILKIEKTQKNGKKLKKKKIWLKPFLAFLVALCLAGCSHGVFRNQLHRSPWGKMIYQFKAKKKII
jgi:hypothetical protein